MRRDNEEKILRLFFETPKKEFTVREVSRITKIPRATAHNLLVKLKKQGLINDKNKFKNDLFSKIIKVNYYIEKIIKSGIVDEIIDFLNPSCIIVFGSVRKGDSVKESDIDLFIESSVNKRIDLKKYEKKLKHKIQVFVESDINGLHDSLFNNVINGIKLYGSIKVR